MTPLPFESKKNASVRLQSALLWLYQSAELWQTSLEEALQIIARIAGQAMRASRVGIWEYEHTGVWLEGRVHYCADTDSFGALVQLERKRYPRYFEALDTHRIIAANDARNDNRTHEFLDDYLLPVNIHSMLDATLRHGGRTSGVLCIEQMGTVRIWSRDEQEFATSISDLVSQLSMFYRLSESEERHRAIFHLARDAVLLMDGPFIIDCNKAAEHVYRRSRDEILGHTPIDLSPALQPDGRPSDEAAQDIIRQAYEGIPQFFTWQHQKGDGSVFPAEVIIERLNKGKGHQLLAIVRDIDPQSETEQVVRLIAQGVAARGEHLYFEQTAHYLARHLDVSQVMIACLNEDTRTFSTLALLRNGQPADNITQALHGTVFEDVLQGKPLVVTSSCRSQYPEDTWLASHDIESLSIQPFSDSRGNIVGFIGIMDRKRMPSHSTYHDVLRIFAAQAGAELERLASNQKLENAADLDELTGLPNRRKLNTELERAIQSTPVDHTLRPTLILLDLNRFKDVNDTLGHPVGDQLLVQVAHRLRAEMSHQNTLVCRMGGDEFAILAQAVETVHDARALAARVSAALAAPFQIDHITLSLAGSLGIAMYPDHGDSSHELMRCADVAMYHAKSTVNSQAVYDPSQDAHSPRKLRLMSDLGRAIQDRQLSLHYQPKISLVNGRCIGCEALLRWQHPTLGNISPAEFIPLAESSDLIHALSLMVADLALDQLKAWDNRQIHLSVAINLSARNLLDVDFPDTLGSLIATKGVSPERIEIEITESALITDPERALDITRRITALGVKLSIDDFGTGYSSLSYLRKLPLSSLKIDRSFVMEMDRNEQDTIIVKSTINLAHNLGLRVVAEGVESAATLETLSQLGCDMAQGYHVSRPLPATQFEDWLFRQMRDWAPNLF
jgi:diguanylate cyclase (GGDEF)-like protein/PAS domain S-box-containing protein